MPRIRTLTMLTLLTIMVTALAACSGAPAPQSSGATTVSAMSSGAPTAESAIPAPSTAPAPTAAPPPTRAPAPMVVATATSAPLADTTPAKPNDKTQGRLRISNCVFDGPAVDVYVNGKQAVNGGMAQANLEALDVSGYLYLPPATYSVALVPTGKGIDQALLSPLDVPIAAGHRYTLVMLGQADEKQHTPLVIDETEAYQAIGASPRDTAHITVNNYKSVGSLNLSVGDAVKEQGVPYGGFKAAIWPALAFGVVVASADLNLVLVRDGGVRATGASVDQLDCYGGPAPGTFDVHTSARTSLLNVVDYLQSQTDVSTKDSTHLGYIPTFNTFLAALKTTGLVDMLAKGGPYLVFAPTDKSFADVPKDKLDAIMADPKALAEVIRSHIVEGYFPAGSLSSALGVPGFNRMVTNLRGEQLTLQGDGDALMINGTMIGPTEGSFVANGTRVMMIGKLLLPDAK